jgi:hypothetical protein
MSYAGFVILVILVLLGIWIFVKLAALPGKTAKARNHPQSEAINILGWIGLLVGVVPWLIALVWAYLKDGPMYGGDRSDTDA